jgi:hypothetical protein
MSPMKSAPIRKKHLANPDISENSEDRDKSFEWFSDIYSLAKPPGSRFIAVSPFTF